MPKYQQTATLPATMLAFASKAAAQRRVDGPKWGHSQQNGWQLERPEHTRTEVLVPSHCAGLKGKSSGNHHVLATFFWGSQQSVRFSGAQCRCGVDETREQGWLSVWLTTTI